MTKYVVGNSHDMSNSRHNHGILIVPPLFIITVFCFGFVMMQPHKNLGVSSTASNKSSPHAISQAAELPPLTFTSPSTLPSVATAPSNTGDSSLKVPQSPTNSGNNLQSADGNSHTITSDQEISVATPTKAKTLTNNESSKAPAKSNKK